MPAVAVDPLTLLGAVPLGVREDGRPFTVRVRQGHTMCCGATGAGKGSFVWGLIRQLAPLVKLGIVRIAAFDLKGGMELAMGAPLFARFVHDAEEAADALEDLVVEMKAREDRCRGVTRLHVPTPDDPLWLIVLDELAELTAYVTDRSLRARIDKALALLLSQGRAVGYSVVAALQDPRKEVLPQRGLFPTRIALRLNESGDIDMCLGNGARERGADCTSIPVGKAGAGVGYVWCDGEAEPVRIRLAWVSDDDITEAVERYGPDTGGTVTELVPA
jgi:S-DNA-T family DNA segregation ATPase FtsK/SpoIIIE